MNYFQFTDLHKKSDNAAKSDKNEYNFVIPNISRTKMLVELIKFGALNLVEDKLSLWSNNTHLKHFFVFFFYNFMMIGSKLFFFVYLVERKMFLFCFIIFTVFEV